MQRIKDAKNWIMCLIVMICLAVNPCGSLAAESLLYPPCTKIESGYSADVNAGTIRYISQVTDGMHFHSEYWPEASFGRYYSPNQECFTASISMALSYLGINRTPKEMLEANDGATKPNGWGADYFSTDVITGMENYITGNGKYSPVVVHLPGYSARGHYLLLVGKVSENVYQVLDPWEYAVEYITIDGVSARYTKGSAEIEDTIDKVGQWHQGITEQIEEEKTAEITEENKEYSEENVAGMTDDSKGQGTKLQEYVKPKALKKLKAQSLSSTIVKLTWKKQSDVTGYKIYKKTAGQTYKLAKTVADNNCKITVTADKTYRFKVVPYCQYGDVMVEGKGGTCKFSCKKVVISAAGDCTLGVDSRYNNRFNEFYKRNDSMYFLKNVKSVFENDDLTIVNLEGALTNSNARAAKTFTFKGKPSYTKILTNGSIEVVNMANNHTRDFGSSGLSDTKRALEKAKIPYCMDSTIAYKKAGNTKVAFLGFNALNSLKKEAVKNEIKKAKGAGANLIIVSFHWGIEGNHSPTTLQKSLGHYAIDQGANLVLGHHPHVLQGIESYKGCYIVYSLGNFCFGGNSNPSDKDTMIFQQTFYVDSNGKKLKETSAKVIPCSLSGHAGYNDFQPVKLSGDKKKRLLNRIRTFSKGMHIKLDDGGNLKKT